jgi:hypothetical protein
MLCCPEKQRACYIRFSCYAFSIDTAVRRNSNPAYKGSQLHSYFKRTVKPKTWSVTVRNGHRLSMLGNSMLKTAFGLLLEHMDRIFMSLKDLHDINPSLKSVCFDECLVAFTDA